MANDSREPPVEELRRPALAPVEPSDEDLARDAARDVAGAFDHLARRYQVPLLRFLLRSTAHVEDAEDVLQETFGKLYAARGKFAPGRRFRPWAFAVARRAAIDLARKARPRLALTSSLGDHDPPSRADDAADQLIRADEADSVWTVARRTLGDEPLQALWLYHVEAMPTAEIAVVLDRSWVSVKAMLVRARARLRNELSRREDGGRGKGGAS